MPAPSVVLATASYDHTIRLWEATSGVCHRTLQYADSVRPPPPPPPPPQAPPPPARPPHGPAPRLPQTLPRGGGSVQSRTPAAAARARVAGGGLTRAARPPRSK